MAKVCPVCDENMQCDFMTVAIHPCESRILSGGVPIAATRRMKMGRRCFNANRHHHL